MHNEPYPCSACDACISMRVCTPSQSPVQIPHLVLQAQQWTPGRGTPIFKTLLPVAISFAFSPIYFSITRAGAQGFGKQHISMCTHIARRAFTLLAVPRTALFADPTTSSEKLFADWWTSSHQLKTMAQTTHFRFQRLIVCSLDVRHR